MKEIIERLQELEHDEIVDALDEAKENMILDIDNFKRELEKQKLMSPALEEFIENYMRWDNK